MSHRPPRQKPVLIIQHAASEHPAALRRSLESQGIPTRVLKIFEEKNPLTQNDISGLVVLGGPMGANDEVDHPWLLDEISLLRGCFDATIPIAGICLGAQLLARALGGRVTQNFHPEIGWFPLELTEEGKNDPLMAAAGPSPHFYQWHYDTFFLPPNGTLLASSKLCVRQAYKMNDRVYGFQFHPEADHQLVEEWLSLEGVDEEILLARTAHHQECVQTPVQHRENAKTGEEYSLKFVAAISQLFQNDPYQATESTLQETVNEWIQNKTPCIVHFYGSHGEITPVAGRIERIIHIPQGVFLVLKEESTLAWPIRLDHIHRLEKLS